MCLWKRFLLGTFILYLLAMWLNWGTGQMRKYNEYKTEVEKAEKTVIKKRTKRVTYVATDKYTYGGKPYIVFTPKDTAFAVLTVEFCTNSDPHKKFGKYDYYTIGDTINMNVELSTYLSNTYGARDKELKAERELKTKWENRANEYKAKAHDCHDLFGLFSILILIVLAAIVYPASFSVGDEDFGMFLGILGNIVMWTIWYFL